MPLSFPASLQSCVLSLLHPTCPTSPPFLHPSSSASFLSCLPPFLLHLSCITPIMRPSCPASHHALHPSCPASPLSLISPARHPSYPASLLSCIPLPCLPPSVSCFPAVLHVLQTKTECFWVKMLQKLRFKRKFCYKRRKRKMIKRFTKKVYFATICLAAREKIVFRKLDILIPTLGNSIL